jgi:succinyl-CoA synthetase beta subunit
VRLVEVIAKALVAEYGLGSPPGRECRTADEGRVAAAELGGTVYVKAQIPFGDRASLGLVKKAEDPESAAAHVDDLVGRSVDGMTVGSVLVESAVDADVSIYISVHVEDEAKARVLRIGTGGGAGYDRNDAQIRVALPLQGLELFELRGLVGATGLRGAQRELVTRAAMAVMRVARDWHAYTVEVNPLFINGDEAFAIDAKVELDDYSLASVPNRALLPEQTESLRERDARKFQESDHRGSFRYVQLVDEGDAAADGGGPLVGSHSVGGGESLVVFDALESVGLRPANYCDTSGAPSQEKVAFAAELIASQPHIAGYFFSSCIANQPLSVTAAGLVEGFLASAWHGPTVVRIAGNQEPEARAIVEAWARDENVPAVVVGREVDEWQAAELLAGVLAGRGRN